MAGKEREFEVEEGREVVGRTIVGGRPLARRTRRVKIPIGIEKLLCRAAGDFDFRRKLMDDRAAAVLSLGNDISQSEREILKSIPQETLDVLISRIDLKKHSKRRFMRGVIAATLLAASTVATEGCACTGIGPDDPDVISEQEIETDVDVGSRGVRPGDVTTEVQSVNVDAGSFPSPDVIESDSLPAPGGILPDAE